MFFDNRHPRAEVAVSIVRGLHLLTIFGFPPARHTGATGALHCFHFITIFVRVVYFASCVISTGGGGLSVSQAETARSMEQQYHADDIFAAHVVSSPRPVTTVSLIQSKVAVENTLKTQHGRLQSSLVEAVAKYKDGCDQYDASVEAAAKMSKFVPT